VIDLPRRSIRPVCDPIQSLIYAAAGRAVRHVFVAGAWSVSPPFSVGCAKP
jgi:hypothetical protein